MMKTSEVKEVYPFSDLGEQSLFYNIIGKLRCTVCQNQNLSDSNAPLAIDLRDRIYKQVLSGNSEAQIIEFATNRYGNFILYTPPLEWSTSWLWIGPVFTLLIAMLIFTKKITRARSL